MVYNHLKVKKMISHIIPIESELENLKEIKRLYTPDFIYRFSEDEWRFTANDGEYVVMIKITDPYVVIGIEETEYDFFLKDGSLVGVIIDQDQKISNADILVFFGWEDIDNSSACE